MTAPGRLHLVATLVLLASLAGLGIAQAGTFQTPAGGWGAIDRPAPAPGPDRFQTGGAAGGGL